MSRNPVFARVGLSFTAGAAALLSGCAGAGLTAADLTAQPGKYMLYQCSTLKQAAHGIANRQHELEQLMQKAGTGPAGRVISATTYQPEYTQNQGNLNEIRREAATKQCHDFVPGVDDVYHAPPVAKPPPRKPGRKAKRP